MKIEFDVTEITVLTGSGTDKILLTTTLPEGHFPYTLAGATLTMDAARGKGKDYVIKHFRIEPNIVRVGR